MQRHPTSPAGEAIDITIGDRAVHRVELREFQKIRKYRTMMDAHPGLTFTPFAIDLSGEIGPAAADLISRWARRRAALRARDSIHPGNTNTEVAVAVARAFTRAITAQALAWVS